MIIFDGFSACVLPICDLVARAATELIKSGSGGRIRPLYAVWTGKRWWPANSVEGMYGDGDDAPFTEWSGARTFT